MVPRAARARPARPPNGVLPAGTDPGAKPLRTRSPRTVTTRHARFVWCGGSRADQGIYGNRFAPHAPNPSEDPKRNSRHEHHRPPPDDTLTAVVPIHLRRSGSGTWETGAVQPFQPRPRCSTEHRPQALATCAKGGPRQPGRRLLGNDRECCQRRKRALHYLLYGTVAVGVSFRTEEPVHSPTARSHRRRRPTQRCLPRLLAPRNCQPDDPTSRTVQVFGHQPQTEEGAHTQGPLHHMHPFGLPPKAWKYSTTADHCDDGNGVGSSAT